MISVKIKVERLIIRPIAKMMSEVPLSNKVERRGKKQRHGSACQVVQTTIGEKHGVLGLMNDGIHRIHQDAKDERQTGKAQGVVDACGCMAAKKNRGELR